MTHNLARVTGRRSLTANPLTTVYLIVALRAFKEHSKSVSSQRKKECMGIMSALRKKKSRVALCIAEELAKLGSSVQ